MNNFPLKVISIWNASKYRTEKALLESRKRLKKGNAFRMKLTSFEVDYYEVFSIFAGCISIDGIYFALIFLNIC